MITVTIKPVRRRFTRRLQWVYEFVAANGEKLDPRDTYNNRPELIDMVTMLVSGSDSVALKVYDADGSYGYTRSLR